MYILIVDDEKKSRVVLADFLRTRGHQVAECSDGRAAIELFSKKKFHLVLTDIRMPRMSGIELLKEIRRLSSNQDVDVILFTGYGDEQMAIDAFRMGAYDYLRKPINLQELVAAVERVAEHLALKMENRVLTREFNATLKAATEEAMQELSRLKDVCKKSLLGSEVFFSERMKTVIEQAMIFHKDRSLPILIEGETGTGKEVIARLIHFGEEGTSCPFVDLNCAALAPSLFESELFGYEAGAYTGGLPRGQKGKIDMAAGGTLFLDEITELPVELQAKLLRVLQEKEFYRVGGLKKVRADVRIICATNMAIEDRVEQGAFRRDLFYRLNVGHIKLLPLRERKEEIVPLAELFLATAAKGKKKEFREINHEAAKALLSYNWPGNIRELKNAIELVVALYNDKQLKMDHLDRFLHQARGKAPNEPPGLSQNSQPLKKRMDRLILEALKLHNGNKTRAANYLGISLSTLHRRLRSMTEEQRG
jgi:two-component system response regulator AtoC